MYRDGCRHTAEEEISASFQRHREKSQLSIEKVSVIKLD